MAKWHQASIAGRASRHRTKVVHVRSEVMDASDKERFNMKEHEQV